MKKLLSVMAVSLTCAAAGAQTANFEGFSAALNMNLIGASTKTEFGDAIVDGLGKNAAGASVQLAYGFALSKDVVLGIGGTYALSSPKVLSVDLGEGAWATGKAKKMASLYVEPGYLLSDKTMVYGKLSYESAKVSISNSEGDNDSKNVHGTGFGAGIRTMLDKNLFLQVEVKRIGYGSTLTDPTDEGSRFKTSATVGTVGIGYKF